MTPAPFGRYLLLELLAEGGMAQVYRAVLRDASGFEKQVALKRIRRELGNDPEFIARFVDEARIASTLSHGNIAQVFDFGQVAGEHYLAMELVDGPDLGTLLGAWRALRQPFPIPAATHVLAEVCRGLGAAHGRRPNPVVHRDVSPQNVLLSRTGEVKVVDFGIALAAEKALRTRTGLVLGKCRYMAPEQARGERLDARADVFAAGCLLFELLTGRPLFQGETPEAVLAQLLAAPIPAASTCNPEVPPELDEILARALQRDRQERPADGSVLARDLEALLHRMAPDYSREDLAALIEVTVPAPVRPAWEAAPTVAEGRDPALAETDRGEPRIGPPTPSPVTRRTEPPVFRAADGPAAALSPPPSWVPPSVVVAPQSLAAPEARPARIERRSRLRRSGVLLLAALLGSSLGAVSGLLRHHPRSLVLRPGTRIEHSGWQLRLLELARLGPTMQMRLRLRAPAGTAPAGPPSLALDGRPGTALQAASPDGEEWWFSVPLEPRDRVPALRLDLRGARPLRLSLAEPGR